jgi:lysine 2,3-aminomutase
MEVDHVQTLRLATRSIAYYPHLFLAEDGALLAYLKRKNLELQAARQTHGGGHPFHPSR